MTLREKILNEQFKTSGCIKGFFNEYRFLSNFHYEPIEFEDRIYPCVENAYQASKSLDLEIRAKFENLSAKEAQNYGQKIHIRSDWDDIKYSVMEKLIRLKFRNKDLYEKLQQTSGFLLEETNWWGDKYWGVFKGEGLNNLGKILMNVRDAKLNIIQHDIWDIHDQGYIICVATNGMVKPNGENVMGGGTAFDCARRYPNFPLWLGQKIKLFGNNVFYNFETKIFTFPTKEHFKDPSSLSLIEKSCEQLCVKKDKLILSKFKNAGDMKIFLPVPGVGLGNLSIEVVFPILKRFFAGDQKIIIIQKPM